MKCLVCPTEIDENKSFPVYKGPDGRDYEDVVARLKLAKELEAWTQVSLTAQVRGGNLSVMSGHLCPVHGASLGNLVIGLAQPAPVSAPKPSNPVR